MSPAVCLLTLLAITVATWVSLWPMLFPADHPRYVAPQAVADVPNVTYRGVL